MEGNGRKLGWIAIGLGVVALAVALGGHSRSDDRRGAFVQRGFQQSVPAAPPLPAGPQFGNGPQFDNGPQFGNGQQPGVGPQFSPGPRDGRGFQNQFRSDSRLNGPRNFGPLRFFFLPFMLIGGLVRTLLFLLLIFLAVRFFRRRGGPGQPWGSHPGAGQPDKPGPEQPPYTGETRDI